MAVSKTAEESALSTLAQADKARLTSAKSVVDTLNEAISTAYTELGKIRDGMPVVTGLNTNTGQSVGEWYSQLAGWARQSAFMQTQISEAIAAYDPPADPSA
jgi:hypothetical protein